MLYHFHLSRRAWYPWLFLGLAVVANGVGYVWLQPAKPIEQFILVTGAVAGFVHFLYAQHYQETQFFASLFQKFNERYDMLNERLNAIIERDKDLSLTHEQIKTLFDYFNLCAEEHLYYASGYIDHEVWIAWVQGMKHFAKDAEIKVFWQSELAAGSYYGFKLSLLDAVH